jgi:hypothetical protein
MSGKTIGALRRNLIGPLKQMLYARGYTVVDHRAENYLTTSRMLHIFSTENSEWWSSMN